MQLLSDELKNVADLTLEYVLLSSGKEHATTT
jgi:hypothetical protein